MHVQTLDSRELPETVSSVLKKKQIKNVKEPDLFNLEKKKPFSFTRQTWKSSNSDESLSFSDD